MLLCEWRFLWWNPIKRKVSYKSGAPVTLLTFLSSRLDASEWNPHKDASQHIAKKKARVSNEMQRHSSRRSKFCAWISTWQTWTPPCTLTEKQNLISQGFKNKGTETHASFQSTHTAPFQRLCLRFREKWWMSTFLLLHVACLTSCKRWKDWDCV